MLAAIDLGLVLFWAAFVIVFGAVASALVWNRMKPRDRLARGFGLGVEPKPREVRRGDEVELLVSVSRTRGLTELNAGIICTEEYEEETTDSEGRPTSTTRSAIAHQAWVPIEHTPGTQSIRLAIPFEAPFSYEGSCLSFTWEVAARGQRSRRLDAEARRTISVLP